MERKQDGRLPRTRTRAAIWIARGTPNNSIGGSIADTCRGSWEHDFADP